VAPLAKKPAARRKGRRNFALVLEGKDNGRVWKPRPAVEGELPKKKKSDSEREIARYAPSSKGQNHVLDGLGM